MQGLQVCDSHWRLQHFDRACHIPGVLATTAPRPLFTQLVCLFVVLVAPPPTGITGQRPELICCIFLMTYRCCEGEVVCGAGHAAGGGGGAVAQGELLQVQPGAEHGQCRSGTSLMFWISKTAFTGSSWPCASRNVRPFSPDLTNFIVHPFHQVGTLPRCAVRRRERRVLKTKKYTFIYAENVLWK